MSDVSHLSLPLSGRLEAFAWRVLHRLERKPQADLPEALRKLPDHLLRDIGIDRAELPLRLEDFATRADMLESRTALAAWLSFRVR